MPTFKKEKGNQIEELVIGDGIYFFIDINRTDRHLVTYLCIKIMGNSFNQLKIEIPDGTLCKAEFINHQLIEKPEHLFHLTYLFTEEIYVKKIKRPEFIVMLAKVNGTFSTLYQQLIDFVN